MRLALCWWPVSAGGSQQAVRGNSKALREAGHDVDLFLGERVEELARNASKYDAVVLPFVHYDGDWSAFDDTHVHLQLGGYPSQPRPDATQEALRNADTVSVLDPSILPFFEAHRSRPIDTEEIAVVPNPPNTELFPRQPPAEDDGHALVVKLGSANKRAGELVDVASVAPETDFVVHYTGEGSPQTPENVTLHPPVPFTAMPRQYRRSSVVVNPSARDVLPNTAYEAWLSGRPYICRQEAIGQLQSLPADTLDAGHWGQSVEWWHDAVGPALGTGDHYVGCESGEQIGAEAERLSTDREGRERLVAAADDWLAAWDGWDWESKGHILTAIIENGGPL